VLVSVANATEVERLTKENAVLRNEVEQLKQELSAAEVQHKGLWSMQLSNYYFLIIINNCYVAYAAILAKYRFSNVHGDS